MSVFQRLFTCWSGLALLAWTGVTAASPVGAEEAAAHATPVQVAGHSASAKGHLHIPEPMIFDLVRGLGARRGELEVNVLGQFPLDHHQQRHVEWAPEVEAAVLDGVALELELPFEDGRLEAYKGAAQFTLGAPHTARFLHGLQFIVESVRGRDLLEASALYVPGYRFDERWSTLWLIGVRREYGADREHPWTLLLNGTLFLQSSQRLTWGFEVNFSDPDGAASKLLLMPQLHYTLTEHWSFQLGLGTERTKGDYNGTVALRVVATR